MPRTVKCGLIQATNAAPTDAPIEEIKRLNIEKHLASSRTRRSRACRSSACRKSSRRLTFAPSNRRAGTKRSRKFPMGRPCELMQEVARRARHGDHRADLRGRDHRHLLQHRRGDRCRRQVSRQVSQEPHSARQSRASGKSFISGRAISVIRLSTRPSRASAFTSATTGTFPKARARLGLNGAEIVFNPSATVAGLSEYLWRLEQPAHAVANGYFVGAINRVGHEQPWDIGEFYGQSYFCDPRGQIIAEAPRDQDALVVADLGSRHDSRSAQHVAVLPRPPAGFVRRAGG